MASKEKTASEIIEGLQMLTAQYDQSLIEKDGIIEEKEKVIEQKEKVIEEKEKIIEEKEIYFQAQKEERLKLEKKHTDLEKEFQKFKESVSPKETIWFGEISNFYLKKIILVGQRLWNFTPLILAGAILIMKRK